MILPRLLSHRKTPMASMATKAPLDWLPMAATPVNTIAAAKPHRTQFLRSLKVQVANQGYGNDEGKRDLIVSADEGSSQAPGPGKHRHERS